MIRLKSLAVLSALALSACGGTGAASPPPAIIQASPMPDPRYGLIVYTGDDLVSLGCDAAYNQPWPPFQSDTPNGVCSSTRGETSVQTLARLPAVLALHPKVLVILTGLNDIRDGSASTEAIISMVIEAQAQGVIVIVCTLPTSAGLDADIQRWNASIREIAHSFGAQLSDLYAGIANPASVVDVATFNPWLESAQLMDPEGVYPSAAGYLVIWDVICVPVEKDGVVAP
jgi:hypothetical protein